MPFDVRTNSGSSKYSRSRPSAVLTRGWLTPSCSAARLTLRVSSIATRYGIRFRSRLVSDMLFDRRAV